MERLYAEIQMVVLSCAAAHSGALPPRRRKSPFQYIMTQAAPARRAQRAPNQRGSGDEVPRGGWEGTRRSRVGGQGACPLLGLKGQSPWSRTLDHLQRGSPSASRARATHPSCVVRRATMPIPPCARIPQRHPKHKIAKWVSKGPNGPSRSPEAEHLAGCRALCSCGSPVGTSPKAKATSNVG